MNLSLNGKISLVTASTQGIGLAIARSLAAESARVVLSSRDESRLNSISSEIGAFGIVPADLSKPKEVESLCHRFTMAFGSPEILVINMPGPPKGLLMDLEWTDWQMGFEALFSPAVQLMKWAMPAMKEKGFGRIVLVTSLAAKEPIAKMPISSSLRTGLSSLVKLASRDLIAHGITVNAVLPGWTLTPGVEKLKVAEAMAPTLPQKRLLHPQEIGDVACFLCSQQASGLTGQSILVDGGATSAL
jgi:3-oxoacyl-[acyl-carrier protein] reductase